MKRLILILMSTVLLTISACSYQEPQTISITETITAIATSTTTATKTETTTVPLIQTTTIRPTIVKETPTNLFFPGYESLTLDIEPGDFETENIYLKKNQRIYLNWFVVEGERLWFHINTPTGKNLGFYNNGQYAQGTLEEGFCQGFIRGWTQFSPIDYNWGTGYYGISIDSYGDVKSKIVICYRIEDE